MDATDQLNSLKRMPFSEIKTLPPSSSIETVDSEGRRFQVTTWCEQVAPDKYRVVVSLHQMHGLGTSTVSAAEGFTVDADGKVESLDPRQVRDLFL